MLESIGSPADLTGLSQEDLRTLAAEIRTHLVDAVSKTGGHLGPNLGVVELTIAIHRAFDSPRDPIVFDTGHQSYVHKLLTGRQDFSQLRKKGGISGYPNRAESEHDVVENSHASTALSWAAGIARGNTLQGRTDRTVVAVIGDGALTGGMAWEALNQLADSGDRIVIVVNDNGRSYARTMGGLAQRLDDIRTSPKYERFLGWGKRTLAERGRIGQGTYRAIRRVKHGMRALFGPEGLFEDLGIKYIGPVDGHDIHQLEHALHHARDFGAPVIVHALTEKGRGYEPAVNHEGDKFHAVGRIHPETGLPIEPSRFGWTAVFADEMLRAARERPEIVGITAAMKEPVGLCPLAEEFPDRVIDVGIAEQHAATAAAGLAFAGMHPVVAVYSTFLNRAFDQILMDVALHHAGVTFMLDRAGVTGDDGPSHNGVWDLAVFRHIPGIRIAAPRDEPTLRAAFREAIAVEDGPTLIRYPKGEVGGPLPALPPGKAPPKGIDVLREAGGSPTVVVFGLGAMAATAGEVAAALERKGVGARAATATWVVPTPPGLAAAIRGAAVVVTIEDGLVEGGVGEAWEAAARGAGVEAAWIHRGVPREFCAHASRPEVFAEVGLEPAPIVKAILRELSRDGGAAR
ncbi:MAG: 1-deoxy-D-xylulose-5-phosphate synthase [Demequinaceae bacterium]|nr:1-deoxy-D-xylulose-5-phosphate synthase [Demequinaceae bacterium]